MVSAQLLIDMINDPEFRENIDRFEEGKESKYQFVVRATLDETKYGVGEVVQYDKNNIQGGFPLLDSRFLETFNYLNVRSHPSGIIIPSHSDLLALLNITREESKVLLMGIVCVTESQNDLLLVQDLHRKYARLHGIVNALRRGSSHPPIIVEKLKNTQTHARKHTDTHTLTNTRTN